MPATLAAAPPTFRSEDQFQAAFVRWCRSHDDARLHEIFHIPNGGARDGRTGGVMVALGARSGVPDLFLPVPVTTQASGMAVTVPGFWLELKHGDGDTSAAQDRWLRTLAHRGYHIALAWGLEEAQAAILAYLDGHGATATQAALDHIGPGPLV